MLDFSKVEAGEQSKDIPESARIVAIADVFDALTMERPYKRPWSMDKAFSFIEQQAGSHFDPELPLYFYRFELK